MLQALEDAENDLKRKQESTDQDMMMAAMVSNFSCFKIVSCFKNYKNLTQI